MRQGSRNGGGVIGRVPDCRLSRNGIRLGFGMLELCPLVRTEPMTVMTDETLPRSTPAAAESGAVTIRYLAAVCLLPLMVLWSQDNILFTGYGYIDPWVYWGYFRNLVEFKRSLPPGSPSARRTG